MTGQSRDLGQPADPARDAGRGKPLNSAPGTGRWAEMLVGLLALATVGGVGLLLAGQKPEPKAVEAAAPLKTSEIPASPGVTLGKPVETPSPSASAVAQGKDSADGTRTGTIPPAPTPPPVAKIPPPVLPEPKPLPQVAPPPAPTSAPSTASSQASSQVAQPPAGVETLPPEPTAPESPVPEPAEPSASPREGGAVATTEQRTPLRSDYRVMLGTFPNRASVQAATAGVAALGYTVYAIDVGSQYVAQVGPFADAATTQQAVDDIKRVYARAELYPPRGQTVQTATPTQEAPDQAPAAPQTAAPAPEVLPPEMPQAAAPSGDTYLQVGAFNNPAGAQQLVAQLRAQGFSPSVSSPDGGKAVVVIGPFSGDGLTGAEQRLDAAGFEHFRLR